MATGVLDEIELQSKRLIEQKKQEVAQLAQYKESLQTAIEECNKTLARLQADKKNAEAGLKSLKEDEGAQKAKVAAWEQEAQSRLNEQKSKVTAQAQAVESKEQAVAAREKEVARREHNLTAQVEKMKSVMRQHQDKAQDNVTGLIADLG